MGIQALQSTFQINVLWKIVAGFCSVIFCYTLGVFIIKTRVSRRNKKTKAIKEVFTPMIGEFLFYEEDDSKKDKKNYVNLKIKVRALIEDPFNRKALVNILLDLRKDLSGDAATQVNKLYQSLGLQQYAYENLEKWRWHNVASGIVELSQMEVTDAYSTILRFLTDRRATVRKQAELAIVALNNEGISYFLDTTKYKISEWQQLKLIEILAHKRDFSPPNFSTWLISKNNDVVLFALRLIKQYLQNNSAEALIELLKHENEAIIAATINCIQCFNITKAVPNLKLVFWKSTVSNKIEILNALGQLGTTNEIDFLKSIAEKESNLTIKTKAQATINTIKPMSIMPFKDIQKTNSFKVPSNIKAIEVHVPEEILVASNKRVDGIERSSIEQRLMEAIEAEIYESERIVSTTEEPMPEGKKTEEHLPLSLLDINTASINDIEVSYQILGIVTENEVVITPVEKIPVTYELLNPLEIIEGGTNNTPKSIDEIDYSAANNLEVSYEVFNNFNHATADESYVLVQTPEHKGEEMSALEWVLAENDAKNELRDKIKQIAEKSKDMFFGIPKAVFMSTKDNDTLVLLENLEQLGDNRDIDLLNELLQKENNPIIKERILGLIAHLKSKPITVQQPTIEKPETTPYVSVFKTLFETLDVSAQLILMEELIAVGDEKEITLLQDLSLHESAKIRKKANECLSRLSDKLITKKEDVANIVVVAETVTAETKEDDSLFSIAFNLYNEAEELN